MIFSSESYRIDQIFLSQNAKQNDTHNSLRINYEIVKTKKIPWKPQITTIS